MNHRFFSLSIICCLTAVALSCSKRTPAETKALLIGRWETVTNNEFEAIVVFNDSVIEEVEFLFGGKYEIDEDDTLTIGTGPLTTKAKIIFKENERNIILVDKNWSLRLRKID